VKLGNELQNLQEDKVNKEIGKVLKTSLGCTEVKKKRDTELKTSPETNDEIKMLSSDDMPLR
jgi:hypothetical protein